MPSTQTMSVAQKLHAPAMAEMLADAFIDDVGLSYIMPSPTDRRERLSLFFPPIVRGSIANGLGLRSAQDEAVTLWRMPPKISPGLFETLSGLPALIKAMGDGQKRARALSVALKAHQPQFPYWYLQFAGVFPAHQGKGLGGAAVRAGLERARAAGMPVYLEAFIEKNVQFYTHLGFETLEAWDVPDGGPRVWSMLWR